MKTVGSILKAARHSKGFSFEEISKFLKIHPKYLSALEEGKYGVFSDPVHIRGFLKNYAEFLELNVSEVLAFFRREYKEDFKSEDLKGPSDSVISPKLVITPAILATASILMLIMAFFSYLFIQYRSFASAPRLEVKSPAEDIVVSEKVLNIFGETDPDSELTINGQRVEISENGIFATTVSLSKGVNNLIFKSVNKLGKESKLTRTVVSEFEEPAFIPLELPNPEATKSAKELAE